MVLQIQRANPAFFAGFDSLKIKKIPCNGKVVYVKFSELRGGGCGEGSH